MLVDDEVNTTFSLRLPVLEDGDALRYGMILLGRMSFRASFVLGPPDAAQNWIRLSKSDIPTMGGAMDDDACVDAKLSGDGTSEEARNSAPLCVALYEDSGGKGNPAPMMAGVVLPTAMDRSSASSEVRSAKVKSK